MGRKKYFKTLKGLAAAVTAPYLDAATMAANRANFKHGGICNFSLDIFQETFFWDGIANIIWTRGNNDVRTAQLCYAAVVNPTALNWFLSRLIYNGKGFKYIAAQDYKAEMRRIRKELA